MHSVANPNQLSDKELNTQNPSFLVKGALLAKKVGTVALKSLAALTITAGCIVGYGAVGALCGAIALPIFIVVAAVVLLVVGTIGAVGAVLNDPSGVQLPKNRPVPDPKPKPKLWIATKAFLWKTSKFGAYIGGFLGACVGLKVGVELSWNLFVKNKHVTDVSNTTSILNGLKYIGFGAGALALGPAVAAGGSVKIGSPGVGDFNNSFIPKVEMQ